MPSKILHIQNQEAREKAISRVCATIAVFAVIDALLYLFLNLYLFALLLSIIAVIFGSLFYLNKKGHSNIASVSLIVFTNLGVLVFSAILGFGSGIYLYLFAAPLLTYMLFDFKKRLNVYLCFVSYLITFFLTYWIDKENMFVALIQDEKMIHSLYALNMTFSFILCFVLISYFSFNNSKYINLLIQSNELIWEQKNQLGIEFNTKNVLNNTLNESLKERELLLSEIHHRVKNNLAVVNGLLELQSSYLDDEKTIQALKESQNRIKSIALLHEKLYEHKTLKEVNVKDYINELTQFIEQSYAPAKKEIKFHSHIDNINLEMDKAMPFALLLNELMSNSYKYAFTNKEQGSIEIAFTKQSNNYIFEYSDTGLGFDYNTEINKDSLGLNLITSFSQQLNGHFEYINKKNGMFFVLKFQKTDKSIL
jgi:two-component sensor histidine kinase